jgi:hypothetical protein
MFPRRPLVVSKEKSFLFVFAFFEGVVILGTDTMSLEVERLDQDLITSLIEHPTFFKTAESRLDFSRPWYQRNSLDGEKEVKSRFSTPNSNAAATESAVQHCMWPW